MVCPNCHSDEIIAVQDQHYCINCGQIVPESAIATPQSAAVKSTTKVQPNGLPEGVEILPLAPGMEAPVAVLEKTTEADVSETPVQEDPLPDLGTAAVPLIHSRPRLALVPGIAPKPLIKRRKPGRPKKGRLDVPAAPAASARSKKTISGPILDSAPTPALPRSPLPAASALGGPRRLNDLAPRRAATSAKATVTPAPKPARAQKPEKRYGHRPHRVGVPALHYLPVIAFSLRARARPRLVALAAMGALSLGLACAYGVYQLLQGGGVPALAAGLVSGGPKLWVEGGLLALIYYIGRSLGQTAIMYGIAREADQRPVTMSRQLGVAVNTFGRRLRLDLGFGLGEGLLIAGAIALFMTGGQVWPINPNLQAGAIFAAYLVLLYLLTALAIARGLGAVNLTLTHAKPGEAALLGWQLFSHRIELIGPRCGALLLEALLAVPLVVLGVALVVSAPPGWHTLAALGAGALAWLAGALLGVGTAAWWAMLYRQLVAADRPNGALALLSGRQPEATRRGPLALIVVVATLAAAAVLILPWLSLI